MKKSMNFLKKNAFYIVMFVFIAGVLAVAGITGFVNGEHDKNIVENAAQFEDKTDVLADTEATALKETESLIADEMTGYNADLVQKILNMIEDGSLALEDFEDESSIGNTQTAEKTDELDADKTDEAMAAGAVENTGFQKEDTIAWPVEGEILLGYSMDTTVFYPTLDAYKCNPSILIQAEEGAPVFAVFSGTVLDVYEDDELGTVVETSLGNGYEACYGQLKDVTVIVGETVEKGQSIAKVAAPTRYYSVEGSHLNFKLTKDGEPINPVDYLE